MAEKQWGESLMINSNVLGKQYNTAYKTSGHNQFRYICSQETFCAMKLSEISFPIIIITKHDFFLVIHNTNLMLSGTSNSLGLHLLQMKLH